MFETILLIDWWVGFVFLSVIYYDGFSSCNISANIHVAGFWIVCPNVFGCLCDSYEELENEIRNVMNGGKIPMGIPPIVDMNNALEDVSVLLG